MLILLSLPVRAESITVDDRTTGCTKGGLIPVCQAKWDWDCIEGTEVVEDHCDIYDRGCNVEVE